MATHKARSRQCDNNERMLGKVRCCCCGVSVIFVVAAAMVIVIAVSNFRCICDACETFIQQRSVHDQQSRNTRLDEMRKKTTKHETGEEQSPDPNKLKVLKPRRGRLCMCCAMLANQSSRNIQEIQSTRDTTYNDDQIKIQNAFSIRSKHKITTSIKPTQQKFPSRHLYKCEIKAIKHVYAHAAWLCSCAHGSCV